jgi:hypothetical protein
LVSRCSARLPKTELPATPLTMARSDSALPSSFSTSDTFVAGELSVEVELTADAQLGQLVPPQPGTVEVHERDGSADTVDVDDVGWFVVEPVPRLMFRLRVRTVAGPRCSPHGSRCSRASYRAALSSQSRIASMGSCHRASNIRSCPMPGKSSGAPP